MCAPNRVIAPYWKPRYGSQMSCMLSRELVWEGVAPPHKGMTQWKAWARGLNVIVKHLWYDKKICGKALYKWETFNFNFFKRYVHTAMKVKLYTVVLFKMKDVYWGQYDSYVLYWPRFGKSGLLVTICHLQITVKQKTSYDVRFNTTVMISELLRYVSTAWWW